MAKAMFVGLSVAFFTAYALIAQALLVPQQDFIQPISETGLACPTQGVGSEATCISDDPRTKIPIIGPLINFAASTLSVANQLFSGFFQLITFQAEGLSAASVLTLLIFVPLGFINAFIIFTAIRGSS